MTASNGDPSTGSNATPAPLVLLRFTLTGTYHAAPADYSAGEPAAMAAEDLEAVTAAADRWGVLDPMALVGALLRTTCGELDHVTAAITPDTPDWSEAAEEEAVVLSASRAAQVRVALVVIADGGPMDGRVGEPDPRALANAALAVLAQASTTTPPTRPHDQRQDPRRG